MVLRHAGQALALEQRPDPVPGAGELRVRVEACAVCRTDLHIVDGELDRPHLPLVPGHEIVGIVEAIGPGVAPDALGKRVGIPWLGHTCGHCPYCAIDAENLCDDPVFTGYSRDGGFASHVVADAVYAFALDGFDDPVAAAPLMCAGLIGWRCLRMAGDARRIGLYGFGAAAHILAQVCRWQGREVYAFTRAGDTGAQQLARQLGACWTGVAADPPPKLLDAAIIFAPVGELVPLALQAVRKGRSCDMRRHLYERRSGIAISAALGRAAATLGRQSHAHRCRRIPQTGAADGDQDLDRHLPSGTGQPGARRLARRPRARRRSAGALAGFGGQQLPHHGDELLGAERLG